MPEDISTTIIKETRKTEDVYPIDLFKVVIDSDAQEYLFLTSTNHPVDFFDPDPPNSPVTYNSTPNLSFDRISSSTSGELPDVSITISNVSRAITDYVNTHDLRGNFITIMRVFSNQLGDISMARKIRLAIDSVTMNANTAKFTLIHPLKATGLYVPKRRYYRGQCQFHYKDENCDPDNILPEGTCDRTLETCRAKMQGKYPYVRYGGFPGIPSRKLWLR